MELELELDQRWKEAKPVFETEAEEKAFEARLRIKGAPRQAEIDDDEARSWCEAAHTFIA